MKFRKKPVEIEAMRLSPEPFAQNWPKITEFFGSRSGSGTWQALSNSISIYTLEGLMTAGAGDWIIKGVAGEFYPCKDEIFQLTYERVDDEA